MRHPDPHLFGFNEAGLVEWCEARGWPAFRARQILEWVYRKSTVNPDEMTNLSASMRSELSTSMVFESARVVRHEHASDETQKLLLQWDDPAEQGGVSLDVIQDSFDSSRQTECVMIPTETRRTACISSQVGCPVGCKFCASGIGGLDGNLSAGRIVEQVWRLNRLEQVSRISNVVFMGMGEPLANIDAVIQAVRTLAAPWGMGIGARKITISTVGLPKAIQRLARELELPVTLALSLHAPNDDIRRTLIPWSDYTTIRELLDACHEWFRKTGREITLEYILIGGVNDQPEHARELSEVARTIRANINLIRYNEVAGLPFDRPRSADVHKFQELLIAQGMNVHIRASRGRDIAAACGQLRHEASHASG